MLATDLLLLALDDERGTVLAPARMGLDFGLAGATLMELALRGCITVEDERVTATGATTGEPLLDDALRAIAAKPDRTLAHWVQHLPRDVHDLRQRLLDALVTDGTLEKRDQRVLLLFHRKLYPEQDGRVEHDVRARLDAVLLHGKAPDPRMACLVHLAAAARVTDAIYPRAEHRAIESRIAALDDAGKAGADAVTSAVVQAQAAAVTAAMMGAIAASTVAATSAATTAACSASSVACS